VKASFSYDNPKVFNFVLFEGACLWFEVKIVSLQFVKHLVDQSAVSLEVLFLGLIFSSFGVNHDVVHIN